MNTYGVLPAYYFTGLKLFGKMVISHQYGKN
jgi:hypothetical protein